MIDTSKFRLILADTLEEAVVVHERGHDPKWLTEKRIPALAIAAKELLSDIKKLEQKLLEMQGTACKPSIKSLTHEEWLSAYPPRVVESAPPDPVVSSVNYWEVDACYQGLEVGGYEIVNRGNQYHLVPKDDAL